MAFSQAITEVQATQLATMDQQFITGCINKKHFGKHQYGGEEYGADSKLIDDVFARTGCYIMGKRMFEEGEVHWAEDLYKTDVSSMTEYKVPWKKQGNQPKQRTSGYKVVRILFNNFSRQGL